MAIRLPDIGEIEPRRPVPPELPGLPSPGPAQPGPAGGDILADLPVAPRRPSRPALPLSAPPFGGEEVSPTPLPPLPPRPSPPPIPGTFAQPGTRAVIPYRFSPSLRFGPGVPGPTSAFQDVDVSPLGGPGSEEQDPDEELARQIAQSLRGRGSPFGGGGGGIY